MAKKQIIGVDIGSGTVKIVELKTKKNRYSLKSVQEAPVEEGVMADGMIMDYSEVVNSLKRAYETGGFSHNKVGVSLKGAQTVSRKITVLADGPEELEDSFLWEADQYINKDIEEVSIDFSVIKQEKDQGVCTVVMSAAEDVMITDYISVLNSAAMEPAVIDLEVFALVNIHRFCNGALGDPQLVVHIGYSSTLLVVVKDGWYDYAVELEFGTRNCIEMMQQQVNISDADMMARLIDTETLATDKLLSSVVRDIFARELTRRIEEFVDLYSGKGFGSPGRFFLSGGGASLFGVKERLTGDTGVPVDFLDPITKMDNEKGSNFELFEDHPYALNVAIGMALREIDG